jgi:glycerophosphoryl diester phosphodiesterase
MSDRPLVIAHRGASAGLVDNSLEAFARAIEVGSDMIEFDVRRTADNQLIILHAAEASGYPISSLTCEKVAQSLGYRPPLLEEVLDLAKGRIGLDVELKEDDYVEQVMSTMAMHVGAHEIVVTSFLDSAVAQVKRLHPDVKTGLLVGLENPKPYLRTRLSEAFPVRRTRACGADFVAMHHQLAGLGALRRAHSAGYPGVVWTVNDDDALRRFLADKRVYAVITDVPERALALRAGTHGP